MASYQWESNFVVQMQTRRLRLELTQTELANRLRSRGLPFHQQTVQRVEKGDRPLRLDEAFVIAEVLGSDITTMTRRMGEEVREAYYAVDRLRRVSDSEMSNAVESWSEWSDTFDELLGTFQTEFENAGHKATPLVTWLATWVMKGLAVDESYDDLVRFLNGIASTSGEWREDRPELLRGASQYSWVIDENMWLSLPEKARPNYLFDMNPQDLYDFLSESTSESDDG